MMKLKCNNKLDKLWNNLEEAIVLMIYGPAGAGKTTLCLQFTLSTMMRGGNVLFISTEDSMFLDRLEVMCKSWNVALDYEKLHVIDVRDFLNQYRVIVNILPKMAIHYSLIVIDSHTGLFRLSVSDVELDKLIKIFNIQNAYLRMVVDRLKIPLVITSQVRGDEVEDVVPIAHKILEYWSDIILRISEGKTFRSRIVDVVKHPQAKGRRYILRLDDRGLI